MADYGVIELGGTKTIAAVGHPDGSIERSRRFETTGPDEIVRLVAGHLLDSGVGSVGVASFGPLELRKGEPDYGKIVDTPKPGWSGTNLVERFNDALGVPVELNTDVNAAALAEGRWGAASDVDHHAYVTVGTGIGFGLVAQGDLLGGLSHPELGHLHVVRRDGDEYPGSCPYHGDCLEGLASGPAIAARFGGPAEHLDGDAASKAADLAGFYLSQAIRALCYSVSPQRVVIGGGLSNIAGFHEAVADHLASAMAGYRRLPEHDQPGFIVSPELADSGLAGAILLAMRAGA